MATTLKGTIWGGVVFSASPATVSVPTGYLVYQEDVGYINRTITIPNGVSVVEVYGRAINIDSEPAEVSIVVVNNYTNKAWLSSYNSDDVEIRGYVGVSPNKRYSIRVSTNTHTGASSEIETFYIKYSPEINKEPPTITDY